MSTTITLDHLPAGFSAESVRASTSVTVRVRGFVSSEEGDELVEVLDQISDLWLSRLPRRLRESAIDHVVIVFRRDQTAEIFVNEINMHTFTSLKKSVGAGEMVERDAVADVHRLVLTGVDVPPDAGVLVVLSARWRRGVLYDFAPLGPDAPRREQNELERMLASAWTYLLFQERVGLADDDWARFGSSGWFPFIGLPTTRIKRMRHHARAGWSLDDLLPEILEDVRANLPRLREQVGAGWLFEGHRAVISKALEHFEAGDYMSAAAMLYPRIEGLMRAQHARVAAGTKITQRSLAESAVADPGQTRHEWSLLLPARFETYLTETYFAHFDPAAPTGVGRNTVGHGVAPEADLDAKAAVIAVLAVEQLAFMCATAAPAASS